MKKSKLMAMMALSSAVLFGALVGVASDARAELNGTGSQYIYKIVNVNSGKVLDVEHGSKEATYRLVQWEYLGLKSQQWTVLANGNGTYTIVNVNSGMAIEPAAVTNGARIWQRDYIPGRDLQHWFISSQTGGATYTISNAATLKLMDIEFNSKDNGWNVHQWDYVQGVQSQLWRFERIN